MLGGLVAYTGNAPGSAGIAIARGVMIALPILTGVFIWERLPDRRFGRLLVLAGTFNVLAALSGSDDELLYSVGRVATWLAEIALFYLILSYPSGRLGQPADRWLFGSLAAVVLVLFLPTALVTAAYPAPATWTTCAHGCPANAFQVVAHQPPWVGGVVVPLRESVAAVLSVGVVLRLLDRMLRATTPVRRSLSPVFAGAAVHAVALPAAFALRRTAGADAGAVVTLTWVLAAGLPVLAVGFLLGALRWRLAVASALYRMASQLPRGRDPQALRDLLAEVLEDPGLDLVMKGASDRWVDSAGRFVQLPREPDRSHTMIRDGDAEVAAVLHDEGLAEQQAFVEVAGAFGMMALANERLTSQVEESLHEVRESRERILAAAYDERRRIERDLHDGAQQRLVALQIKLELASERSREQHLPDAGQLHQLTEEVGEAAEAVRSLAAGVYPAVLADYGLYDALRSVARRSPVAATVAVRDVARLSEDVEAAIYFCCLEALQNAAKHADARSVSILVTDGDDVRFEVRDDGRGFDSERVAGGRGLTNIRDRVAAVGGSVAVVSRVGRGTRVAGVIPHAGPR